MRKQTSLESRMNSSEPVRQVLQFWATVLMVIAVSQFIRTLFYIISNKDKQDEQDS